MSISKKENKNYEIGYKIGYENGKIREFEKTIENKTNSLIDKEKFIQEIFEYYVNYYKGELLLNVPFRYKDAMMISLGYTDGAINKYKHIATDKYHKKIGLTSKSYKLKVELVENFEKSCKKNKKSQASILSELMQKYIDEN